jgi:hypothetical protein
MIVLKRSIYCLFTIASLSGTAHAHISMKGALQSRGGDQKQSPCDGSRGDGPEYTFAPGATITLSVNEDIPHPSYFRIAFDNDGEDFVEPASIEPIDKSRACPFDKDDQCGKSDFCTSAGAAKGAIVLWDNLDPHLSSAAKGGTWQVKLPDVECSKCTIQVLQIMEDTVHGAYCPQGTCAASANSLEDIYHRCIDIKLVKGAPSGPGVATAPVSNQGVECPSPNAAGGAAGSSGSAANSGTAGVAATTAGGGGRASAGSSATMAIPMAGAMSTPVAMAGAGGSSAAAKPTTTSPNSGTTGTGATGALTVASTGTAGKPASAGTSSGSAGSPSAAKADTTTASTEAPKSNDGGCSVAQPGARSGSAASLLSLMMLLFGVRRRKQIRA